MNEGIALQTTHSPKHLILPSRKEINRIFQPLFFAGLKSPKRLLLTVEIRRIPKSEAQVNSSIHQPVSEVNRFGGGHEMIFFMDRLEMDEIFMKNCC